MLLYTLLILAGVAFDEYSFRVRMFGAKKKFSQIAIHHFERHTDLYLLPVYLLLYWAYYVPVRYGYKLTVPGMKRNYRWFKKQRFVEVHLAVWLIVTLHQLRELFQAPPVISNTRVTKNPAAQAAGSFNTL